MKQAIRAIRSDMTRRILAVRSQFGRICRESPKGPSDPKVFLKTTERHQNTQQNNPKDPRVCALGYVSAHITLRGAFEADHIISYFFGTLPFTRLERRSGRLRSRGGSLAQANASSGSSEHAQDRMIASSHHPSSIFLRVLPLFYHSLSIQFYTILSISPQYSFTKSFRIRPYLS